MFRFETKRDNETLLSLNGNSSRYRSSLGAITIQRGAFEGGVPCYEILLDVVPVWGHYPVSMEQLMVGGGAAILFTQCERNIIFIKQ